MMLPSPLESTSFSSSKKKPAPNGPLV